MTLLYNLPLQEDVESFKKIKILCAPPGLKNFAIDADNMTKQELLNNGFTEVSIGITPKRTLALKNNEGNNMDYSIE